MLKGYNKKFNSSFLCPPVGTGSNSSISFVFGEPECNDLSLFLFCFLSNFRWICLRPDHTRRITPELFSLSARIFELYLTVNVTF